MNYDKFDTFQVYDKFKDNDKNKDKVEDIDVK